VAVLKANVSQTCGSFRADSITAPETPNRGGPHAWLASLNLTNIRSLYAAGVALQRRLSNSECLYLETRRGVAVTLRCRPPSSRHEEAREQYPKNNSRRYDITGFGRECKRVSLDLDAKRIDRIREEEVVYEAIPLVTGLLGKRRVRADLIGAYSEIDWRKQWLKRRASNGNSIV
jgi:hypothetical protein